jgi:hypothetical protein
VEKSVFNQLYCCELLFIAALKINYWCGIMGCIRAPTKGLKTEVFLVVSAKVLDFFGNFTSSPLPNNNKTPKLLQVSHPSAALFFGKRQ